MRTRLALCLLLGAVSVLSSCGGDDATPVIDPGDGGDYVVSLDPADFVPTIDNPWLPLTPGARWTYESRDGDDVERTEVTVTEETRTVLGIRATVVRDTVRVDGSLVEDTYDWFAQDSEGTVWYLGEDSREYEDGQVVSTAGSWEAGVDGALPGVVMWAEPTVGKAYRQEFYEGEAEDLAEVIALDGEATVPTGTYTDLVVIREWNPLEPDVVEEKHYARDVGLVLERTVQGGSGEAVLVSRG